MHSCTSRTFWNPVSLVLTAYYTFLFVLYVPVSCWTSQFPSTSLFQPQGHASTLFSITYLALHFSLTASKLFRYTTAIVLLTRYTSSHRHYTRYQTGPYLPTHT